MKPEQDYFSAPGLSNSGMADLAVSPLRYWYKWVRPDREPEEPTPFMVFGSALHCAVLEPDQFERRYARELDPADYPGVLRTIEDLRGHLAGIGVKPKGTRKADIVAQVLEYSPDYPIWDVLERDHALQHEGKEILSVDFWQRVNRCAEALRSEPALGRILDDPCGYAEQPVMVTDPDSGVPLKGKLDWVTPTCTLDLKTFTVKYGKSVDRSVADAVYYEGYARQAYFYSKLRTLQSGNTSPSGPQDAPPFIVAFVESDEPHEVRLRSITPKSGREVSALWERARIEATHLIRIYAHYSERFGETPWREEQSIEALIDEEFPQLAYAR